VVEIDFKKGDGLVPVIVQDHETGEVLMLAYMNQNAWLKTLETGKATYWSRSRSELWVKGETSGHVQIVKVNFSRLRFRYASIESPAGRGCSLPYGIQIVLLQKSPQ